MWECVNNPAGCAFDAVSINPGVVLGEVLCKLHTKSSAVLLRQAIYNNPVLNYPASYVDVKDVARMHLRCLQVLQHPKRNCFPVRFNAAQVPEAGGHRFIATCDHETMNTVDLCGVAQRLLPQYERPPLTCTLKSGIVLTARTDTACTRSPCTPRSSGRC